MYRTENEFVDILCAQLQPAFERLKSCKLTDPVERMREVFMQRFSDQMHKTAKPGWRWCPKALKYLRRGNATGAKAKVADQAAQSQGITTS